MFQLSLVDHRPRMPDLEGRQARDDMARKFTDRRLKQKAEQDEGPKR